MQLLSLRKFIVVLLILALAACGEQEQPVTKDEALKLAHSIENSMKRRSAAKFNEAFDAEAMAARIQKAGDNKINKLMLKGAVEGFREGSMGTQLVTSMGKGGSYELVKQYEKDNKQHVIFRLFSVDGKVNYHDLELVKKKGQIRIADMFVYLSGENISTTMAQTLASMNENYDNMDKKSREKLGNLNEIRKALNAGKYEEAEKLYQQLPSVIKEQKMAKVIHISIASGLGEDVYMQALNDFERDYPHAPNLFLMKVDAYILKKNYQGAMHAVNQLDSLIDKDHFLDYYRGLVSNLMQDKDGRRKYFERLVTNRPDFAPGMLELIAVYMDNNEREKGVELARKYKTNSEVGKEELDVLYQLYPELQKEIE